MASSKRRSSKGADDAKKRTSALSAIAAEFGSFRHARDVLSPVRSVPTCFVQYDHGTRVGGHPIERIAVIHGKSNEGKTAFALGLIKSFLAGGHFANLVDAERTTPITWVRQMMADLADSDRFYATRPSTYEKCVDEMREFFMTLKSVREKGLVSPNTSAVAVVDSLRKLVPEDIFKKIIKEGASGERGSVDGMGGRAAQIRAAMNAAWMDELVPLCSDTGGAFVAIARESEDPNADMWAKKFGNDYKVGGGKAVIYDASLVLRITRANWVVDERGGMKKTYGEKHRVEIKKTKVGGKEDRTTVCYFHTSNGLFVPAGLDRARDVLELGQKFGVVHVNNGRIGWPGYPKSYNIHDAVKMLTESPTDLADLEQLVRDAFAENKPTEVNEDGEVIE